KTEKAEKEEKVEKKAKKVEVKEEVVEDVDYTKKTVAELKEIASEKGVAISSTMKKADIIEALTK
ncbi:MAG: Rho termination factor N-terminal domain-containing protein, partial [Bacilli bacterium]|nr:Rho termination factor N-terminal domain-containing protein [Bacilli bacterium]